MAVASQISSNRSRCTGEVFQQRARAISTRLRSLKLMLSHWPLSWRGGSMAAEALKKARHRRQGKCQGSVGSVGLLEERSSEIICGKTQSVDSQHRCDQRLHIRLWI